jgi:hypothetical protein
VSESKGKSSGLRLFRALSVTIVLLSFPFILLAQKPVASERFSSLKSLSFLCLLPESLRVYSGEGGEVKLIVTSNRNWILYCSEKWISSDSGTGGGLNEVRFKVTENPESFERTAKIVIKAEGLPFKIVILSQKARHNE